MLLLCKTFIQFVLKKIISYKVNWKKKYDSNFVPRDT